MNRQTTERLAKRLDAIEGRQPESLPTVEWHIVEPSPCGGPPVPTGEVIRWNPATGRREMVTHAPG